MNKLSDGYEKIICHEYCHFLIGDSVWQIVKYAFLCLLWFDPLVWIAYMLIQMDNELAVDELVIKRLGEDKRVEYGEALLSYANAGATNKLDLLSVNSFVGNNKDFIKKRIRNISKGTRKSVAALIIMSMVFTIMVSCSTVTPVVRASVIKEDDPWYETSSFTMGEQYNQGFEEDEYIFSQSWMLGEYDGCYLFAINAQCADDGSSIQALHYYSKDGEIVKTIDLYEKALEKISAIEYFYLISAKRAGDYVIIQGFDVYFSFDLSTETMSEGEDYGIEIDNMGVDLLESFDYGKYHINILWVHNFENSCIVQISDEDGSYRDIDLCKSFPGNSIDYIVGIFPYGENKIGIMEGYSTNNYYEINLESGKASELSKYSTKFLDDYKFKSMNYVEGAEKLIATSDDGFYEVNFISKKIEKIFDWNSCVFDHQRLMEPKIISYSEDEIVLTDGEDFQSKRDLVVLTKVAKNPNAGKKILWINDNNLTAAINKFNSTDDEYFVCVDYQYDMDNFIDYSGSSKPYIKEIDARYELENKLMVDIKSGDGPDLIVRANDYFQLLDSDYLLDISDIAKVDGEYDSSKYFTNILEASELNGQLLYMPLSMEFDVILTIDKDYEGKNSLSYQEYNELVNSSNSGRNLIGIDKETFVLLGLEHELKYYYDDNGYIDFNNEYFKSMVEYAKDNIGDGSANSFMLSDNDISLAKCMHIYSIYTLLNNISYSNWNVDNVSILPEPSNASLGFSVDVGESIAISATSKNSEGCYRFIQLLMSEEIQNEMFGVDSKWYSGIGMTTINRNAFEQIQVEALDLYNEYYQHIDFSAVGFSFTLCGEDKIDIYRSIVENCTNVRYKDSTIEKIVIEEIQAYFAGDKSFEEVVKLINNRVKLVSDERK